jgi:RHS repeat-associated protein
MCDSSLHHARLSYKFTGKERDAESVLDMFGARYYASTMGRFMTPDWAEDPDPVPYANLGDPQSLNLYGYVRNNPTSNKDDDGHDCTQDPNTGNIRCVVNAPSPSNPPPSSAHVMPFPWWDLPILGGRVGQFIAAGTRTALTTAAVPVIVASYFLFPPYPTARDTTEPGKSGSKIPHDAADPNGAKAPGKPGAAEGFADPKSGPKWGKAGNGRYGWVDASGNVWVPTGQSPGLAHGGPHWDVQQPGGGYQNVRPGGKLQ